MKKLLFAPVALLVVLTLIIAAFPAGAAPPVNELPISANVVGLGTAPTIQSAWLLAKPNGGALQGAFGAQTGPTFTPNHAPNLSEICTYAVISDLGGLTDVTAAYADIYHPDGTQKIQIHQVKEMDFTTASYLVSEGVRTGQITSTWANTLTWMLNPDKYQANLWWGCFQYEVHQAAGLYTLNEWAIDKASARGALNPVPFTINPITFLAMDFSTIDWGTIVAGTKKVIAGDDVFDMAGNSKYPTVWNQGNISASLTIWNSPMTGTTYHKLITQFDAQLMESASIDYAANETVLLRGPLVPCTPHQIEFSIHPPVDLAPDSYAGTMRLSIKAFVPSL